MFIRKRGLPIIVREEISDLRILHYDLAHSELADTTNNLENYLPKKK